MRRILNIRIVIGILIGYFDCRFLGIQKSIQSHGLNNDGLFEYQYDNELYLRDLFIEDTLGYQF